MFSDVEIKFKSEIKSCFPRQSMFTRVNRINSITESPNPSNVGIGLRKTTFRAI